MRAPAPILALIALMVSFFSGVARADSALVVLVRPPEQSPIVSEAITRIRGELIADGFDVSVVDAEPGSAPASTLEHADQQGSAAATIGLFLRANATSAELWVVDRLTGKTVVRSVELANSPADQAPEVLARRSVELLRASLLEILVEAPEKQPLEKPSGARAKASSWAAQALEPAPSRWAVEAGAQLLGVGGVGSAVMPLARVRFAFNQRLGVRLTLAGLGTHLRVESPGGSATMNQQLALLELVGDIFPEGRLRPSISVGAGAYHIGVEGSATPPYVGLSDDRLVFAADAGIGLALALSRSWALALEGHVILVTPYPVIRFVGAETTEIGNPLLSGTLSVMARL
jgi:hypothetical protein